MSSSSSLSANVQSNLESFLHSVTPIVPSKPVPQSYMYDLNSLQKPGAKEITEYFTLGDLWQCYDEWSAYGVGTPVVLNNGDNVLQYYVPYLSAIQIYTNVSSATLRNPSDDIGEMEFEFESSSNDGENDKLSRTLSNNSSKAWDSTSADSSIDHEGLWSMRDYHGGLYFEYYATCSPYCRIPLMDKITEFTQNYPGLVTLRSIDLSAASWMAVAWYPIYHIPTKGNVKDLSASFLTFHTLSSTFQEVGNDDEDLWSSNIHCSGLLTEQVGGKSEGKERGRISLPPFGLATYKMQGHMWKNPDTFDCVRLKDLVGAAGSWLKQLNVQHHDFNFFTSHSMEIGISL